MRLGYICLLFVLLTAAGCGNEPPKPTTKPNTKIILVGKERLVELLAKKLHIAKTDITLDKKLAADLGVTELDFLELVMAVQESFNAEITDGAVERKFGKNTDEA